PLDGLELLEGDLAPGEACPGLGQRAVGTAVRRLGAAQAALDGLVLLRRDLAGRQPGAGDAHGLIAAVLALRRPAPRGAAPPAGPPAGLAAVGAPAASPAASHEGLDEVDDEHDEQDGAEQVEEPEAEAEPGAVSESVEHL